jgi:hypothetical protein
MAFEAATLVRFAPVVRSAARLKLAFANTDAQVGSNG